VLWRHSECVSINQLKRYEPGEPAETHGGLDWIETIRDLSLNGVANLRNTPWLSGNSRKLSTKPPVRDFRTLELEGHGVRIPRHVPILGTRILQRKPDERHAQESNLNPCHPYPTYTLNGFL